jgi:curved DNA-binding protein CbpA
MTDFHSTSDDQTSSNEFETSQMEFAAPAVDNFYQILNVNPDATRLELRESFLRLKATFSSGNAALYSLIGEDEAGDNLTQIEDAFKVLNDIVAREEYDLKMGFTKKAQFTMSPEVVAEASYGLEGFVGADSQNQKNALEDQTANTERIEFMRSQQNASNFVDPGSLSSLREAQPIVRIKAEGSTKEQVAEKFSELIEANDHSDGDLFRQLREAAGVSVEELQDRTKVCVSYIKDIEANRFDRLPQLVYVRGFLRGIFKYLGVRDSDKLVKAYAVRLEEWLTAKNN